MEESMQPQDRRRDESLAGLPPMAVPPEEAMSAMRLLTGAFLAGAAGLGAICLVSMMSVPTHGATRSSKLKWEQRQQEIERAQRDAQTQHDDHR